MKDELAKYDLKVRYNEAPDSEPIDWIIYDDTDNVAFVWGSHPANGDVQVECNHPDQCIEYGDDDECGACALCGATCAWSWVPDYVEPTTGEMVKSRKPYEWHEPKEIGGIIGDYLEELKERW